MKRTRFVLAAVAAALAVGATSARAGDEKAPTPKEEPKTEAPAAPAFTVKDLDGKDRTLAEFQGKWVVLEWTNPGCPYVKKFYTPGVMQALQKKYTEKGVVWLSVCSTNAAHKDYKTAEQWKAWYAEAKFAATAVLLDTDSVMGKAYGAMRTPEIRIVGPKGTIEYLGAVDDNKDPKADPTTSRCFVSEFLDAVLAEKAPPVTSSAAYG